MRSQLFATSKEKTKKTGVKTRVETSPPSTPTKSIDPPPLPEVQQGSPSLEGLPDHLPEPDEQPPTDDVSSDDEPLDIN